MRRSRFTEEQDAGMPTAEACRKYGVSTASFYKYKAKFGCMDVSDAPRLKALEDESAKLKKLLAEQMLDNAMLTPAARWQAVAHLCKAHGVTQRRACSVLQIDRSSARYTSIRSDDDHLRVAIKTAAAERRRFGYRRIHVMLEARGIIMNQKKPRRLYREEKLQMRKRGGRKRALGTRRPMVLPSRANERWSLDFVSDAFTDGRRFRVLAIIDDFSKECLALVADTSLSGLRMTRKRMRSSTVAECPERLSATMEPR